MKIFTLEIDGRPTVVFDASSIEEARGISALPEFRADLSEMTTAGAPLCSRFAVLSARDATAGEIASFNHALTHAVATDGPTMTFLVPVDGMLVTIVQPES